MTELYRYTAPDGSTGYADQPPTDVRSIEQLRPGRRGKSDPEQSAKEHADAVWAIKEAQRRIPRLKDYWDYLEFLRTYNPLQYERVLAALKQEDPGTWVKLQRYPQFRPLRETALGHRAVSKNLAAGIGLASGKFTGSVERWLETTVQDLMKQQRYGPYADAMGAKASTQPAGPAPSYSNSRLGQHRKEEDARLSQAAKHVEKESEASRAAVRSGVAAAISRPGTVLLDFGLGALDAQTHAGATRFLIATRLRKAYESGALDDEQYMKARDLFSQGQYQEMQGYLHSLSGSRK